MSRFFDWTPDDDPAEIIRPQSPADWKDLHERYAQPGDGAQLGRVLELAQEHGVLAIVVERRYIDADYRSEHAAFYSTTFRRYPSVCHRLHFFKADVADDLADLAALNADYVGYSVMRPLRHAPVGKTMMAPPPRLAEGTVCGTTEEVHLFGASLTARGMPFISQDAQFLRCAHAAQWMVLRHSTLRYDTPKWLTADVQAAALGGVVVGRQVPSEGLSFHQMLVSLDRLGLSPGRLPLPTSRDESRAAGLLSLPGILCRHVNSQFPVIVVSDAHAWVVVGYTVSESGHMHDRITFYRHDDAAGPYIEVPDPWNEPNGNYRPWSLALTPLQRKCYVTAERAELLGSLWLQASAIQMKTLVPADAPLQRADITFRTYAVPSWEFKRSLARIPIRDVAEMYRLAHLPRFIWVVEALDRNALEAGERYLVLGEVLIDATANHVANHDDLSSMVALHLAGVAVSQSADHDEVKTLACPAPTVLYASGCPAATA